MLIKSHCVDASPFVARTIAHLSSEQVLRALYRDVAIGLIDLHTVLEALSDLLCEAYLLLWHKFVWQALRLRALSPLLGLGADHLLGRYCSLRRSHVALLLTSSS